MSIRDVCDYTPLCLFFTLDRRWVAILSGISMVESANLPSDFLREIVARDGLESVSEGWTRSPRNELTGRAGQTFSQNSLRLHLLPLQDDLDSVSREIERIRERRKWEVDEQMQIDLVVAEYQLTLVRAIIEVEGCRERLAK